MIVAAGSLEVYGSDGFSKKLEIGDSIVTYTDTPMGMRSWHHRMIRIGFDIGIIEDT